MNFILVLNFLAGPIVMHNVRPFSSEKACYEFGKVISADIPKRLKADPFFCLPLSPNPGIRA